MSETHAMKSGPVIGEVHEVRATFVDANAMHEAIERLEVSGFDRADLSLPEVNPPIERATPESGAKPADTDQDARQARTLHTSTAAAAGALAAAGITAATGGTAAAVVAGAVIGGGVVGGVTHAISSSANSDEQEDRERKASAGVLMLSVRASTAEKRTEAEAILRSAGAAQVQIQ